MNASKVKRPVYGVMVKLFFHKRLDRGMRILAYETRCVQKGELHELVSTDQQDVKQGGIVDRVGYFGFAEIQNGGVIEIGDRFYINEIYIGIVLGFDDTHYPNHYNILIATDQLLTADDLDLQVEQRVGFCSP